MNAINFVGALYVGVSALALALIPLAFMHPNARKARQNLGLPVVVASMLAAWYGIAMAIAGAGGFETTPGRFPTVIVAALLPLVLGLGAFVLIQPIRAALSEPEVQPFLIAMQTYRVVGIGFLVLALAGELPAILGVPAGLGDLLIGLTAPGAAAALKRGNTSRAILWNVMGLLDLAVAVTLAVGTGLSPLEFIQASPSSAVLSLAPLVVVPSFLVPLDIMLHVISLTGLLRLRSPRQNMARAEAWAA
jgi:hypothetical protein